MKKILDCCCGSRMFWFDRKDDRSVFTDIRKESHTVKDSSSRGGVRHIHVSPDLVADFTDLPFRDSSFAMVIFDPPHLVGCGSTGWQAKKYGKLPTHWKTLLTKGFSECFRVLKPEGTLIFKWNEEKIAVAEILALTTEKPVIGQRCGRTSKTHWIVFMKGFK